MDNKHHGNFQNV